MAELSSELAGQIHDLLSFVYGADAAPHILDRLRDLIARYPAADSVSGERLTERDVLLITYGDTVRSADGQHLKALHAFIADHLQPVLSAVHILPFYPYTSDDGFSVVDYKAVDPTLGTWDDIDAISHDVKIMFDAVINHISASSAWVKGFVAGDPTYKDYFIVTDPSADLSSVTRPRALPLLTPFDTSDGTKYLWTTFSADQIDVNYANPDVLLAVLNVLLFYVSHHAALIRLDAIGYLWKEISTSSIHLPQTHAVVQLMRAVLNAVAPATIIVTETNVPHKDNISYFGDGHNEAQMVYQFPLPPLTLHALLTGDATYLSRWAATLAPPSDSTTFFNFLASHDGIGVVPALGIIGADGVRLLADTTLAHGGQVSYKNNNDGSQSPYELNITYFDALSDPHSDEPDTRKIARFVAAQAIMMSLQGVPGIYFLSMIGGHNWQEGYAETGRARTLNRQKFEAAALETDLADPNSHAAHVFARLTALLALRRDQAAFHPNAAQSILSLQPAVFGLLRTARDSSSRIMVLVNVSDAPQAVTLPPDAVQWHDLIGGQSFGGGGTISLNPHQVAWLRASA